MRVDVATGDVGSIEDLHGSPDDAVVTCPERSGACAYAMGPDRPDDYSLPELLDHPHCSSCGASLVITTLDDYRGPTHEFRGLDAPADGGVCL